MDDKDRIATLEGSLQILHETLFLMHGQQQALLAGLMALIGSVTLKPAKGPIELARLLQDDADRQLLLATDETAQDLIAKGRENIAGLLHGAFLRASLPPGALEALRAKGSSL